LVHPCDFEGRCSSFGVLINVLVTEGTTTFIHENGKQWITVPTRIRIEYGKPGERFTPTPVGPPQRWTVLGEDRG
jgi:hypothetical protein